MQHDYEEGKNITVRTKIPEYTGEVTGTIECGSVNWNIASKLAHNDLYALHEKYLWRHATSMYSHTPVNQCDFLIIASEDPNTGNPVSLAFAHDWIDAKATRVEQTETTLVFKIKGDRSDLKTITHILVAEGYEMVSTAIEED